jgi:hypothetical protein
MPAKHQHRKTPRNWRRGTAQARLAQALETLTREDARAAATVTVAALCRVANVSRNSLYRYHAPILKTLREHQRHGPQVAHVRARKCAEQRRLAIVGLHADIAKLAALVDHYYTSLRETSALLERRDRQLAELRGQLLLRPALLGKL